MVDLEEPLRPAIRPVITSRQPLLHYNVNPPIRSIASRRAGRAGQFQSQWQVTATAAGQFDRVILTAKVPGPDGEGIPDGRSSSSTLTTGATITVTALQTMTGGASVAGAPVTLDPDKNEHVQHNQKIVDEGRGEARADRRGEESFNW